MLNNGCNDFLFGVHCVEEGYRIPPLQSYGRALKQKDVSLVSWVMTVVRGLSTAAHLLLAALRHWPGSR